MNMHQAIYNDDFYSFESLIRNKTDPYAVDEYGNTILHALALKVNDNLVKQIFFRKKRLQITLMKYHAGPSGKISHHSK